MDFDAVLLSNILQVRVYLVLRWLSNVLSLFPATQLRRNTNVRLHIDHVVQLGVHFVTGCCSWYRESGREGVLELRCTD